MTCHLLIFSAFMLGVIGETVYDPFAGSGSTLIAAAVEGRKAIGCEIEERCCEVAARRLEREIPEEAA